MLERAFPLDPIVGEEDASDLRVDAGAVLRGRIVELANEALTANLATGDNGEWGIGPGKERSAEELLDAIDRGNHTGGGTGREFWPTWYYRKFSLIAMLRHVDHRPDRRDERLSTWRTIRYLPCAYCRCPSQSRRHRMPEFASYRHRAGA